MKVCDYGVSVPQSLRKTDFLSQPVNSDDDYSTDTELPTAEIQLAQT